MRDLSGVIGDIDAEALSTEGLFRLPAKVDPEQPAATPTGAVSAARSLSFRLICVGLNYADHAKESAT